MDRGPDNAGSDRYMAIGIGSGLGVWAAPGLARGNLVPGMGIGTAIGVALGIGLAPRDGGDRGG